jgi:RNA polymerase sigma factor (TIGR02999 family)
MAHRYMSHERQGHTLQTTDLVNEAFLRIVKFRQVEWQDRAHFFGMVAHLMRRVLVDVARVRRSQKRGGGAPLESLSDAGMALSQERHNFDDILAIHEAMEKLAQQDQRSAKVVELRFFGGLTNEEIATVLGVTDRTVKKDWQFAKLWLHRELSGTTD